MSALFLAAVWALTTKALAPWAEPSFTCAEGCRVGPGFPKPEARWNYYHFLLAGGFSWVPHENYILCITPLRTTFNPIPLYTQSSLAKSH